MRRTKCCLPQVALLPCRRMTQRHGDIRESSEGSGVTAVVVTFRRPQELAALLAGLGRQSVPVDQVLVVDNDGGRDDRVQAVCESAPLPVSYIVNRQNSLTVGRNLGVNEVQSEFALLVDDDVELDANYVAELLKVFRARPEVVGLQGYIEQSRRSPVRESINGLFRLYHLSAKSARVMRSISTTYPRSPRGVVRCEWLSGSNQMYRSHVLSRFRWDEQMIMYCDGEDLDLSYRVHRSGVGTLGLVPSARVVHAVSQESRLPSAQFVFMREAYGLYLSYKLFEGPIARYVFVWSRVGIALETAARAAKRRSTSELKELVRAFAYVLRNRRELRGGSLRLVNAKLEGRDLREHATV